MEESNRVQSFKDLYSTSSWKLLRGDPDNRTLNKSSFHVIVELSESLLRRKPFNTVEPTTRRARLYEIVLRADGTENNPSTLSVRGLLREPHTDRQWSIRFGGCQLTESHTMHYMQDWTRKTKADPDHAIDRQYKWRHNITWTDTEGSNGLEK